MKQGAAGGLHPLSALLLSKVQQRFKCVTFTEPQHAELERQKAKNVNNFGPLETPVVSTVSLNFDLFLFFV